MEITVTTEHNLVVGDLGVLTGVLTYSPGCAGSQDQPPEPAELEDIRLRDSFGIEVPDFIWENESNYQSLFEAVWAVCLNEYYNHVLPEGESDAEIPF